MPEYLQWDSLTKRIINKWYSVDPSIIEGLPNILQLSRDLFNSLTEYHIVDNGVVRLMTQVEQDAYEQAKAQAIIDQENQRISGLDDLIQNTGLQGITLTRIDVAIDNIGSLQDAKTFLKKLCRYIIKFIAARQ